MDILILVFFNLFLLSGSAAGVNETSRLHGIQFPDHPSFNSVAAIDSGCQIGIAKLVDSGTASETGAGKKPAALKLHLKHRQDTKKRESFMASSHRDHARIHTLHRRMTERKNQNAVSRLAAKAVAAPRRGNQEEEATTASAAAATSDRLVATLESGVSLGSGEYFMDVFLGTPPKHFSLILDTGSDLNWIQCFPCHDCFEQQGPHYDPRDSSSYRPITCHDPRCQLVSSPEPPRLCNDAGGNQSSSTCQYFYWYGDQSNTTGDFALETFTVNLTTSGGGGGGGSHQVLRRVEDVMFGCGHWNRGLFHGAAGLLGLGRGPLSFSSQLKSIYGHTFSYCLVDRNSDLNVSSKLIFGEDEGLMSHPNLNFTTLVAGKENPVDTFYYVDIKGIKVGGEVLNIPPATWQISPQGAGGTIIDSGTTLSYFAEPAYKMIKEAFENKVVDYPIVKDFPILSPCYNVSGVDKVELPHFSILFSDGAVWDFPTENYFIRLDPEKIMCLAILGTPRSSLSILGNYQQQNFHIVYDTNRSRLGYAPMRCAEV